MRRRRCCKSSQKGLIRIGSVLFLQQAASDRDQPQYPSEPSGRCCPRSDNCFIRCIGTGDTKLVHTIPSGRCTYPAEEINGTCCRDEGSLVRHKVVSADISDIVPLVCGKCPCPAGTVVGCLQVSRGEPHSGSGADAEHARERFDSGRLRGPESPERQLSPQ